MHKPATKSRRRLPHPSVFLKRALELGVCEARVVEASSIATAPWVRLKCRFGCGGYGKSLCCPPHTPTPQEMREVLDCYSTAIFFEAKKLAPTEIARQLEREAFLSGHYKALGLGAGPCFLCKGACALSRGCRHPKEARPCLEACGIDVFKTARSNGFEIEVVRTRDDVTHFFGAVLLD